MSKLTLRKPYALLVLFAIHFKLTYELSFPFLVPRDYAFMETLDIRMSAELTNTGRSYHFENVDATSWGSKDPASRKRMSLPLDFQKLDFMCHPGHDQGEFKTEKSKTAGMVSNSDQVMTSPYEVNLEYALPTRAPNDDAVIGGYNVPHCYQLCDKTWSRDQVGRYQSLINAGYGYRMYLDDLPSATQFYNKTYYDTHIPLGYVKTSLAGLAQKVKDQVHGTGDEEAVERSKYFVYNHLDIVVTVHENMVTELGMSTLHEQTVDLDFGSQYGTIKVNIPQSSVRIVGFTVSPRSIPNEFSCEGDLLAYDEGRTHAGQQLDVMQDEQHVRFSYTVTIEKSDQRWATRLDHYISFGESKLQYEQIVIALAVFGLITFVFLVAMCSALQRDDASLQIIRANYRQRWRERRRRIRSIGNNEPSFQPVSQRADVDPRAPLRREVTWKKIQGEVFRKPDYPFLLSILLGAGAQCFAVFYVVMICTVVDFWSPFSKGLYIGLTTMIFPFFGLVNGYTAARMYTFFNGSNWLGLALVSATFLPFSIGGSLILVDFLEWFERDVHKMLPAYEALTMFLFWLLVHAPVCIFGTGVGFYKTKIQAPTKPNRVPREPPKPYQLPWFMRDGILTLIIGVIPVAVIIFEIQIILDNINGAENIHMISWFMYFAFALFLVVAVQLTIVVNYALVCYEEYRWWWKIWTYSASSGFFIFLVMINYLLLDLQVDTYTTLATYWICTTLMSCFVGLMTASVCTLAAFQFNIFLYSNIKAD